MNKFDRPPSSRTNLASCIVATVFLVFLIFVVLVVFFTLFKPKDPRIVVSAVQLPTFSISNSTVNFTFSQYVSVRNPNHAVFTHYDSSLQLLYAGNQVGFMFIPAGKIDARHTQYMSATFSVESVPLVAPPNGLPTFADGINNGFQLGPTLELESRLIMAGRVRVLHFFTHHVETRTGCRVAIAASDGSVLGFHC
ncbi:PREDICTED: uncharacterized protein LOC104604020 [Nelumbo nucifera]|uniref:Late embryogenesis abundant protein LEA-2 subgroup domain-containing protein n=2 Tax=Nelumbo nucifera TaxID=4432 RepID=A0A822YY86_NELNU|nr:PREDICTED: uncharacterized protein LOC104604020 [Nelumbo nucifera]DAD36259.1 TPA_asm: hypothetical protein HUJ06_006899 [Nelumbo nucifera]